MRLVDRKVAHFEVGTMATVACAASSPPYGRFQLVTAGHPRPVLAVPGRPATLVDMEVLPPLGIGAGVRRSPTTLPLPPGAVLVFYTDGLVERRHEDLDVGLSRLCATVTADDPDTVCRNVMREMIGSHTPQDDVAVLALRRLQPPRDVSSTHNPPQSTRRPAQDDRQPTPSGPASQPSDA
jgi:serine phosphatase RsbU (regulator of sigma subunit)